MQSFWLRASSSTPSIIHLPNNASFFNQCDLKLQLLVSLEDAVSAPASPAASWLFHVYFSRLGYVLRPITSYFAIMPALLAARCLW